MKTVGDELHRMLCTAVVSDQDLQLTLHPAEEPVEFNLGDHGELLCSAKTNSAGPGYHVFLVDLLEQIAPACGIEWSWLDPEGEQGDETGYQEHRDFERVQAEMLKWLRAMTRQILSLEDHSNVMISMPVGYGFSGDVYVASPLGEWSRTWFESVVDRPIEELEEHGSELFPWWNRGRDAAFYANCGFVRSWMDVRWQPPIDEVEEVLLRDTHACFERAKRLDPSHPLPEPEIEELRGLLNGTDTDHRVDPRRVGFRRRNMKCWLTGGWTISLPGYYREGLEDDGGTVLFWHGSRAIRGSSISATPPEGQSDLVEYVLSGKPSEGDVYDFEEKHLRGWATIEETSEDGEEYFVLHGEMAIGHHVGYLTVCFDDPQDKDWALSVWRTMFHGDTAEA